VGKYEAQEQALNGNDDDPADVGGAWALPLGLEKRAEKFVELEV
jgi:hypothetical protein